MLVLNAPYTMPNFEMSSSSFCISFKGHLQCSRSISKSVACVKQVCLDISVEPIGLWPMNSPYGFQDIIGGKHGSVIGVNLDSNAPVDLSNMHSSIKDRLKITKYDKSYKFNGPSHSYVEIPNIPLANDFTYLGFVRPYAVGPLWQWDPSGRWGNHIWFHPNAASTYDLYFNTGENNYRMGLGKLKIQFYIKTILYI